MRSLTLAEQHQLRDIAAAAIEFGLQHDRPPQPDISHLPPALREVGACFVTIHKRGELRGCIGTLNPHRSLAEDVNNNGFSAGFNDYRFEPLTATEWVHCELHISVLEEPQPLFVKDQQDLLNKLTPNVDGVIFSIGDKQATFLPHTWQQLPNKQDFVTQLKRKAGLSEDEWPDNLRVQVYQTQSF
ncbi:AmmeMemoRadiSam system protein A [Methylophaga sp. OBS3]|uniref:AmmeMemoRadiSam system protein A n=1 Tax=Methylophaga sp. OBS3 TaxID=2991934 RepID=UPI0022588840|nr:AmmeMemoRadiSam system protein A [Methylophaga sp. OBS3]MCX4189043.1 AmmeMemoRadiSam system protein A [Methylophaga sp. OBS3]